MESNADVQRKSYGKRAGKALIWFFAGMLVLTYASRAVSRSLKATVETGYLFSGTLDESVEGVGEWAVSETQLYTTYFSRRITQVYVRPGQQITAGTPLFAYDVSTVKGGGDVSDRKLRAARQALEKAEAGLLDAEDPAYAMQVLSSAQQALAYAEFTYEQYSAVQNGGVVRATFSGTLVKCDLSAGKSSEAGVTGVEIAHGGVSFTLRVTAKEAERIAAGDTVTLFAGGEAEKTALTVLEVQPPDADGQAAVVCEGDGGAVRLMGAKQEWKIEKRSAQYQTCIPVAALRQSGPEQYYVLVLREKETILGTELVASRQAVTLLGRDSKSAAVEGSLSGQDRLILSSSKELNDGDTVVLKDA